MSDDNEPSTYRRADDGSWTPAVPLGWQGSGIDWEVAREGSKWVARGYDEDVLVSVKRSRFKRLLAFKIRRAS